MKLSFYFAALFCIFSCAPNDHSINLVKDYKALQQAISEASPGDKITMANGVWQDVEIVFEATGTQQDSIVLQAETPGKVFIEGNSSLKLAGEYLKVSGLVFKNGYTPGREAISFRISKDKVANHCRLTSCVIDDFTNPERFEADLWLAVYGKNNRIDHNTLARKGNQGVTMAVRLDTETSRDNHHRIDHNYFGHRENLGSNGGETLRIGTSHYSMSYSNTLVEFNYFDQCDGEHEIISNKSCGNVYRNNVFEACRGTLTMRHGNETTVDGNYFLGNFKENTGGIRVINEKQTVINNYCYGLTGYRFRGALVVMNGVPNSPLNRYFQVKDSRIEGNIFMDCDHIQLCAGSDAERSAVPLSTTIERNIFLSQTNLHPFTIYDDISGISFRDNIINEDAILPISHGFEKVKFAETKNEQGLWVPDKLLTDKIGFMKIQLPVDKSQVGPSYYSKMFLPVSPGSGKSIEVPEGKNTLIDALNVSQPGSVLRLVQGGKYLLTKEFDIHWPITIQAASGEDKPVIQSQKSTFFRIENGGSLALKNLVLDGAESPDRPGNSVVSTSRYSMTKNYNFSMEGCEVRNLDVNYLFDVLKIYKNTFADTVQISHCQFAKISGSVVSLDKEQEDLGIYNVEHLLIDHSDFSEVQGAVANVYRGGTDESTFGPIANISDCKFEDCGRGKRNKQKASILFHGVQKALIENCSWKDSAPLNLFMTNGEPITKIKNCEFNSTGKIISNNQDFTQEGLRFF